MIVKKQSRIETQAMIDRLLKDYLKTGGKITVCKSSKKKSLGFKPLKNSA